MKNGKRLVWILDDEWADHSVEKKIYEQHGFEVKVTRSEALEHDMPNYAPYADGVVAQVGFACNEALIGKLQACKIISASAVGYNHIDVEAAIRKGITVAHVPDYCSEEVSDHTVAHMLTVARRLPTYNAQVREGKWDPLDTLPIRRFGHHTVGLLGFGRIARRVAQKLKPFGVRLLIHDPYISQEVCTEYAVEAVSFEELLEQSTILSLHVPLGSETRSIIRYEQLKMMPKGSFVFNTCRGGVINEEDLIRAIREGHIAGAGLDVLDTEPPNPNYPLLQMNEVFITPHSSYISEEAVLELKTKTCQNIIDGVAGRPLTYTINLKIKN
ncbi:C-terminal binding protein [Bacillus salipaludis]|uniref:C-terminal binding protein n=1 Tax=Bacillus salipaludis TaxID=2547811 RepID=UPI003D19622C